MDVVVVGGWRLVDRGWWMPLVCNCGIVCSGRGWGIGIDGYGLVDVVGVDV